MVDSLRQECEQYTGRVRQLCRGEAQTLEVCNFYRDQWGHPPLTEMAPRELSGTVKFGNAELVQNIDQAQAKPAAPRGPMVGDILGGLFAKLGVANCIPGGGCGSTKAKMNAAGVQGCKDRRDEFLSEIRERAKSIPVSAWAKAAANAVMTGMAFSINPIDPLPSMYDMAIQQAEGQL